MHHATETVQRSSTPNLPKRPRTTALAADDQRPTKRVKPACPALSVTEEVELYVVPKVQNKQTEDDWATSTPLQSCHTSCLEEGIEAFLGRIRLAHLVPLFTDLGISTVGHLQLLAHLPSDILEELLIRLQLRGLKYIDTILLHKALASLPPSRSAVPLSAPLADNDVGLWAADTIAFLGHLRPSLAHHAPVLVDLGIHVDHLQTLRKLTGTPLCAELESAFHRKGLTFAEMLILKGALRRVA